MNFGEKNESEHEMYVYELGGNGRWVEGEGKQKQKSLIKI